MATSPSTIRSITNKLLVRRLTANSAMTHVLRAAVLGALLVSPTLGVPGASTIEGRKSAPGSEWSGGGLTILSDNRLDSERREAFVARAYVNQSCRQPQEWLSRSPRAPAS